MAPSSATSPSCTYEGGSATWRVPGRVRAEPILGSASWKGWLGSSQVPTLGGMCAGRPQPKESPHSSGGLLHHSSGSDHREALPALASGKPTGDVVGCPTFCTPALPPVPQLILIPLEVLPLQGLRVRVQADLKTYSCAAFQSNESDRASDMIICCSSFYTEIQKLLKVYFNKANSYFTYRSFKSKIQNVEFQFESVVTSHTSKAATPGHTKDTHTHTHTHALWRDPSAERSTWNYQCSEQGGAENTAPTRRLHKQLHTVSQPMETQLQNVFLNREKQTGK